MSELSWSAIILQYVCPTVGAFLSNIMFGAPIADIRKALVKGSLGALNPLPFSMMTGNCIGWCAYAYYTKDPFVLAANLPGLLISFYLNLSASNLQYSEALEGVKRRRQEDLGEGTPASSPETENLTMVPQVATVLRVMLLWSFVLLYVGWLRPMGAASAAHIVGLVVNVNLVFFYGAPLNTILQVIQTKCSDSIHRPTMILNWCNTSFWVAYGFAQRDFYIMIPNGCGLFLGLLQGLLCLLYPKSGREPVQVQEDEPVEENDSNDEASRDSLIV